MKISTVDMSILRKDVCSPISTAIPSFVGLGYSERIERLRIFPANPAGEVLDIRRSEFLAEFGNRSEHFEVGFLPVELMRGIAFRKPPAESAVLPRSGCPTRPLPSPPGLRPPGAEALLRKKSEPPGTGGEH